MSPDAPQHANQVSKDEVVEGGAVGPELEGGPVVEVGLHKIVVFDVEKHRGRITIWLLALLGVIIVGHYLALLVMEWNGKKVEALNDAFHVALPTVSGLAGTAIAYYFTRWKQ